VHLKTSLVLSLALLLGMAPGLAEAQSSRNTPSGSARKTKKPPPKDSKDRKQTPSGEEGPSSAEATPGGAKAPLASDTPAASTAPAPLTRLSPARTDRVVVLAVPAGPQASDSAIRVEAELRGALGARPDVEMVDLSSIFPPPAPASLREGDALFEEGKNLYNDLDPEAAAKKFLAAAEFYQQHPAVTKAERLGRVYIFLGASHLLNGAKAAAREAFTRALLAEPTLQPDSKLFGQDVVNAFNAASEAYPHLPRGTLAVSSVPAGAQVSLHGQPVGTTPLKDVELPAGSHQVVLTLPGHIPSGAFHPVRSGERNEFRATLASIPGLAEVQGLAAQASTPQAMRSDALPAQVTTLSERLGARYVVLATVKQDKKGRVENELHAWDVQTKNRLRGLKFGAEDARGRQEALDKVHAFVTSHTLPTSPTAPPTAMPDMVKKPWFWATVGGVAVATTAGILMATQGNSRPQLMGARLGNPGAGW
jgi:hypothetical protein